MATKRLINFRIILRIIGWLLMIEAGFMIFPIIATIIYEEHDFEAFSITAVVTFLVGILLTFGLRPKRKDMGKREGFLLTALVWVVFSIFGMIPFMIGDLQLGLSDAFFESMSGFTTTGASVMEGVEHLSHGILLWRCLMQWIGGLGIILFTLAVIPMLNHSGGMQMFNAEVTGITRDKIRPRVSQTAKGLWGVYLTLTVLMVGFLWIGPMDIFDSICHSLSSVSTGGFSTRNESIGAWHSNYIKSIVTIFMFLGGINFVLIYKAAHGDFKSLWKNDTFVLFLKMIGFAYVCFVIAIVINEQVFSWESVTIDPLFQIISTITSTGLTAHNFENWGAFSIAILVVLMFFGGCAGSTSGGAKVDRALYLLQNSRNEIKRCLHPNAMMSVRINGRVIPPDLVSKVTAFLCLYVMTIAAGGSLLTIFDIPLADAFFSSFSCVCNSGLGADVTGYGETYAQIPDVGKWILSFLMLIGRLEIFTILVLFTPTFWKK